MNESSNANGQGEQQDPSPEPDKDAAQNPEPIIPSTDYEFVEPELGAAEISEDVAKSVDLEAAAAEAARVEHEAQLAAQGVSSGLGVDIPAPSFQSSQAPDPAAGPTVNPTTSPTALGTGSTKAAGSNKAPSQPAAPEPAAGLPASLNNPSAPTPTVTSSPQVSIPPSAIAPVTSGQQDQGQPPTHQVSQHPFQALPDGGADAGEQMSAATGEVHPGTPSAPVTDTSKTAPHIGPGVDDGHGWRRSETPWQQSATPWQPKAGAWQSPSQIARGQAEAAAAASELSGDQPETQNSAPQHPLAGPATDAALAQQQSPSGSSRAQTPSDASAHHGTPPLGASSQPDGPRLPPVPGFSEGHENPNTPDGPQGPGSGGAGFPGGPQGPDSGDSSGNNKKKLFVILGVAVLGVVLVVFFVSLLIGLISGKSNTNAETNPATTAQPLNTQKTQSLSAGASNIASPSSVTASSNPTVDADLGLITPALSPLKWLEGDCLRGYKDVSTPADLVVCSTAHNAQLVGTFYYSDTAEFPGADALKAKAADVCKAVEFTSDAAKIKTLKQTTAYPSESTWKDQEDRRVDCLVNDTRSGNQLETSLTK